MVRAVEVAAGCLRLTVENSGPPLAEDGPSAFLRAVLPHGPGPCSRDGDRARARGRGRSDEPAWRLDPGGGSGDDRGVDEEERTLSRCERGMAHPAQTSGLGT